MIDVVGAIVEGCVALSHDAWLEVARSAYFNEIERRHPGIFMAIVRARAR